MKDINQEKLFFIIAPDRSGTTIFQYIMNTFSNFCNLTESRIAGPGSQSCWEYVLHHNDFSYLESFIKKNWTSEYFVEKSPPSINCLPQISKKFPNANFIFLKRNPTKIVLSQLNLHYGLSEIGKREDLEMLFENGTVAVTRERIMTKRLLRMIQNQILYKPSFKKMLEIKFEDLTSSLDEQLNIISRFFAIESNLKKAQERIKKPSSSSTFRYGIRHLSDKISKDIIKYSCELWGYENSN